MDQPNIEQYAQNLDSFLSRENPHFLVLGTLHGNSETGNIQVLSHPSVLDVLKKHGFENITLEVRREFQDELDAVAAGNLTPDELAQSVIGQFIEAGDHVLEQAMATRETDEQAGQPNIVSSTAGNYQARGILTQNASAVGMRVIAGEAEADTLAEHVSLVDMMAHYNSEIEKGLREVYTDPDRDAQGNYDPRLSGQREVAGLEASERAREAHSDAMALRMGGDANILDQMERQIGNVAQSKTVIVYGVQHGANGLTNKDLDELLEERYGQSTATVRLSWGEHESVYQQQRDASLYEQPAAYLDSWTGNIVSGEEAYQQAARYREEFSASPTVQPDQSLDSAPSITP